MVAAISLFTILTISVIFVRIGSVALELTGFPERVARFQARSAFTGTGFTTHESMVVVNHPHRRPIISVLMILGNAGIVTRVAALILSYVDFEASRESLAEEAIWLGVTVFALWVVAFSKWTDRQMRRIIPCNLQHMTRLQTNQMESLLMLPDGYQIAAMKITAGDELDGKRFSALWERDRIDT